MKKLVYSVIVMVGAFLLMSCGSKQEDLSGRYYYAQSFGAEGIHVVHQVNISATDQTNKNYAIQERGMYANALSDEMGTLEVDGDLINISLPFSSNMLSEVEYPSSNSTYDISSVPGYKFSFKDDVIAIEVGQHTLKFHKDTTEKGQEYLAIHLGYVLGYERAEELDTDNDEMSESEEVTFSNVTYNPQDATISGKIKNNTDYFIDSVRVSGTLDMSEINGWGEDEIIEVTFDKSHRKGATVGMDEFCVIYHLEVGEEKDFTFDVVVDGDLSKYSNPSIDTSENVIIYREEDVDSRIRYRAMENEYEIELIENGNIEGARITNTSEYQWETMLVGFEFTYRDNLERTVVTETQVDIGETVSFDDLSAGIMGKSELGHVTRVMYVEFEPRAQ